MSSIELDVRAGIASALPAANPADMVSRTLIERAKTDPQAFGRVFEIHFPRVLAFTYRCTWNRIVAEDLRIAKEITDSATKRDESQRG